MQNQSLRQIFFQQLIFCTIIGGLIYLPMTLTPFQRHDDYLLAAYSPISDTHRSEGYINLIGAGRPLLAEITYQGLYPLYTKYATSANFFIILRLFNLSFLIFGFSLFAFWLTKILKLDKIISVLIATLIFTLPGFQFLAGQAVAVTSIWCIPLVMAAILILNDGPLITSARETFKNPMRMAGSVLLLLITLFTYQPNSLMFLLPSLTLLIFAQRSEWQWQKWVVLRHLLIFGLALGTYLLLNKLLVIPAYLRFNPQAVFEGYGEMKVNAGIQQSLENLRLLLTLPRAHNLWLIKDTAGLSLFIDKFLIFTFAVFVIVAIFKLTRENSTRETLTFTWQHAALFILVCLGLLSPHFSYGLIIYYRVLAYLSAILVVGLVWGLFFWSHLFFKNNAQRIFIGMLLVLTLGAGIMAQQSSLRDLAVISVQEINFLESGIQPMLNKKVRSVYIILPRYIGRVGGDEHSMLTSSFHKIYGLRGMIQQIYRRNNLDPANLQFAVNPFTPEGRNVLILDKSVPLEGTTNSLMLDMNVLCKILKVQER